MACPTNKKQKGKMNTTKRIIEVFLSKDVKDLLKIADELPKASFLFVTYNRCPFSDFEKNPLTWAFQTLLSNNHYELVNDFVVIDDGSSDFTYENIKWLENKYGIKINYNKNKVHKELSYSRRIGIRRTKNNLVFMGDDDCLYSKYFIMGGLATYQLLKNKKPSENISVINFPAYERSNIPRETVPIDQIGKIVYDKTFFYHNFDKMPVEYLNSPRFIDRDYGILKPLKVDTFAGVNLCDKRLIINAGNYLDLSDWGSGYSEHIELSRLLNKNDFSIYHQPDPRISCIHLKYGANSRDKFDKRLSKVMVEGTMYRLGEIIELSKIENFNTGARHSNKDFHIIEIGSLFSFYLKISEELGERFAIKEYTNFVEKGLVFSTTPSGVIKSKNERKKIWREAIQRGCSITEKQTKIDYSNIFNHILNEANKYV